VVVVVDVDGKVAEIACMGVCFFGVGSYLRLRGG